MLLKCVLYIIVLNFASMLTVADAGSPIVSPAPAPVIIPSITPIAPSPVIAPPFAPITSTPILQPIAPIAPILPVAPTPPAAPFVPFVATTLPQINFQAQSTTIQPLAAAYQLAAIQAATSTQAVSTQAASTQTASTQAVGASSSLASEIQKTNEELEIKHKKEYDYVIKDNIELLKEKENVLIQLQAQLKLQLEAQKFAAQQRARAIKEMQEKLKQEELKSKKDTEEMKLNVQSIVDLSPLVLNINQPKEKEKETSLANDSDFTNLKKSQKLAKKCKKSGNQNECNTHSKHCSWGRVPKQKKHKCLFMCEKLEKSLCKKVSGCHYKDSKCRSK